MNDIDEPSIVSLEAMINPLGESKGDPQFTREEILI